MVKFEDQLRLARNNGRPAVEILINRKIYHSFLEKGFCYKTTNLPEGLNPPAIDAPYFKIFDIRGSIFAACPEPCISRDNLIKIEREISRPTALKWGRFVDHQAECVRTMKRFLKSY